MLAKSAARRIGSLEQVTALSDADRTNIREILTSEAVNLLEKSLERRSKGVRDLRIALNEDSDFAALREQGTLAPLLEAVDQRMKADAVTRREQVATELTRVEQGREKLERESDAPENYTELATALVALQSRLRELDGLEEADDAYREAIAVRSGQVEMFPLVPAYHSTLATALNNFTLTLKREDQLEEHGALLRRAISHHETAIQKAVKTEDQARYRGRLVINYSNLNNQLLRTGNLSEAADQARHLYSIRPASWEDALRAAHTLAYCSWRAERDESLTEQERIAASAHYADDAVAALQAAVERSEGELRQLQKKITAAGSITRIRQHPGVVELLDDLNRRIAAAQAESNGE